jgi:hypothetical protein
MAVFLPAGTFNLESKQGGNRMNDKWEECCELVEHVFGEKPESPEELVQIMICMADAIEDLRSGERKPQNTLRS